MDHFIAESEDITSEKLSRLLEQPIKTVQILKTGQTNMGAFAHLIADDRKLFVKWTRPDGYSSRKAQFNQREVWFSKLQKELDIPTVKCFAALANDEGASTIILDDLSSTHAQWEPGLPAWEQQCVDALAALHSGFWNDRRLEPLRRNVDPEPVEEWQTRMRHRVDGMLAELGSSDKSELHELINQPLWEDYFDRARKQPLTILHGDPHPRNFLYSAREAVLIDWELVGVGVPVVEDLMHLIVFSCMSKHQELIERYQTRTPYGKDQFEYDWRTALCLSPLLASAFWANGMRGERLKDAYESSLQAKRLVLG
jgi:aminoglycoside phosphotransferase (APT) family kinase protein